MAESRAKEPLQRTPSEREAVSKSEYARRKGVSRQAVYKALRWRIAAALLPDGRLDAALADRLWHDNTHPGLGLARRLWEQSRKA